MRLKEWTTSMTDDGVTCTDGKADTQQMRWNDIDTIYFETTDDGPFEEDVFLTLVAADGARCRIPMGAIGYDDVYEKVSSLPGFDFEAVVSAMSSVTNREFICYKKPQ